MPHGHVAKRAKDRVLDFGMFDLELRNEALALQRGEDAADEPDVYRSNVVLRERWRVRRRRLLERTLQRLGEERAETSA